MCGISCMVALDERRRCSDSAQKEEFMNELDQSLEQIRHRGPDSSGKWMSADGRVVLGHVRLEINDLSPSGGQPLHSNDGTVHTVVNGEIYDYERLRAELEEKLNYRFQGTSDCELVLALYQLYGISFISRVRGEFSIFLYDSQRNLFLAIRDRYGIKPLFWTVRDGRLYVAAEMKAFLPFGWEPEWDVQNIVGGDRNCSNCTMFKNVQKVRPGHMLVCRNYGFINERRYWTSDYPDKNIKEPRTEEEMIQGVRERLLDAVRVRLRADVKIGISLSGGIDSSVVAGMVNQLLREGHRIGSETENERLSCFGIAFDAESGFDESEIANRTADFLNVKFYKKHMNEQELADKFERATWICESANSDLNFIGVYALSELFRENGFTVNINGQGSDELFGGYDIFIPDFLREPDKTYAHTLSMDEDTRISELRKSESSFHDVFARRTDLMSSTSARRQLNNILVPYNTSCHYSHPPMPVKPEFLPPTGPRIVVDQCYAESLPVDIISKIQDKWHPLHSALYVMATTSLPELLLSQLGDRGEMAHSIEGRLPFLDHHFSEYVNNLPPSVKIRQDPETGLWVEKWILREAARPFITDELYKRRKHPYSAPVKYPINGPIYKLLKGLVTTENVEKLGWIETDGVDTLVDEAYADQNNVFKFRMACNVAQWVVLQRQFGVKKAMPVIGAVGWDKSMGEGGERQTVALG